MIDWTRIMRISPFSLNKEEKEYLYRDALLDLTLHHYQNCTEYKKILDAFVVDITSSQAVEDVPFIPVRLFKDYELLSVKRSAVIKTMTSSGTTGQKVSRIFLDRTTSTNQSRVLNRIISDFLGKKRLPMLVIDTSATIRDRQLFSARGAGILGFSMLGYDLSYALDENMELDVAGVQSFLEKYQNENILVFGFTFMIWEHFYKALVSKGVSLPLDNGILIHGGGWKKLESIGIDNGAFKACLKNVCGIRRIYNYYGMVEQTGSIFMECDEGHLHASIYSDVIMRDFKDFAPVGKGQRGLIQLVSLLPYSYPGHSLLSEDEGEFLGEDDCPCGRLGKYFTVHGRIKSAEARGCSDTYVIPE